MIIFLCECLVYLWSLYIRCYIFKTTILINFNYNYYFTIKNQNLSFNNQFLFLIFFLIYFKSIFGSNNKKSYYIIKFLIFIVLTYLYLKINIFPNT